MGGTRSERESTYSRLGGRGVHVLSKLHDQVWKARGRKKADV